MKIQELRPWQHLMAATKSYPNAWQFVEDLRAYRGKSLPDWPEWCFLPMSGWCAIVQDGAGLQHLSHPPPHLGGDVGRLAAIGTWRYSQGIYRFEPDFYNALADTPLLKNIPVEILYRLPEWSLYLETPGMTYFAEPLFGFFAHLEHDTNDGRAELRLLLDTESNLKPLPLHIGEWTLEEMVERMLKEAQQKAHLFNLNLDVSSEKFIKAISREASKLLALLLYVCSEQPDITDDREPGKSPERPKPTRTKKGFRLFAPDKPRVWTVGKTIGEKLRQAKQQAEGATRQGPAPHIRRAHWHGYWTGPRTQKQKFVLKWLPPTVIAAHEGKPEKTHVMEKVPGGA